MKNCLKVLATAVEVDEDAKNLSQLQWARILVKNGGNFFPGTSNLVVKSFCYAVRLWWEVQPRVSAVEPMKNLRRSEGERVRDHARGAAVGRKRKDGVQLKLMEQVQSGKKGEKKRVMVKGWELQLMGRQAMARRTEGWA